MIELKWTDETPTVKGWYWYKDDGFVSFVEIRDKAVMQGSQVYDCDGWSMKLCKHDGQWAGPIPEPTDG